MKIAHVSLIVADIEAAIPFYRDILGLPQAERPELGFPGVFFALGNQQQIHLMQVPNPYAGHKQPQHGGRDRHIALFVEDFVSIRKRLDALSIHYTMSKSGRLALFCRDTDGNTIELLGKCD